MYEMSATNAAVSHEHGFSGLLRRTAGAEWFARFILIAIGLTGILSGAETYPLFRGGGPLALAVEWAQYAILIVFVAEIAVKIGASGSRPWRYFENGWNIFDFSIVAVSLLPMDAEYLVVLRLARVLRLFTALEGLQILVTALLRGILSLGYVGLLLLLHFYIYSVIGTFAFGDNDPLRFGSLHRSMLTLFQVLTLEGWNDILATEYLGSDVGYDDPWKQLPEASDAPLDCALADSAGVLRIVHSDRHHDRAKSCDRRDHNELGGSKRGRGSDQEKPTAREGTPIAKERAPANQRAAADPRCSPRCCRHPSAHTRPAPLQGNSQYP